MLKYLIILCLLLTSCHVHTRINKCDEIAEMQYREICQRVNKDNAGIMKFYSDHPQYKYHNQAMERIPPNESGTWFYYPNHIMKTRLSKQPQRGCKPYKRIK